MIRPVERLAERLWDTTVRTAAHLVRREPARWIEAREKRLAERLLREAGFSKSRAAQIVAEHFRRPDTR